MPARSARNTSAAARCQSRRDSGTPLPGARGVSLLGVDRPVGTFWEGQLREASLLNNSVAFTVGIRGATESATHRLTGRTGGLIFRMLPGNLAVEFPLLLMGLTQLNFMRATLKNIPLTVCKISVLKSSLLKVRGG